MTEIEKEIVPDEKLLELIHRDFKKISKIKSDKISDFIEKNQEELDKISKGRNWRVWLSKIKKKYKKRMKETKETKETKDKFVLQLDDGTKVLVDSLSPDSPKSEPDSKNEILKKYRFENQLNNIILKTEEKILKESKIKEWIPKEELELNINMFREKYPKLTKKHIHNIPKKESDRIQLYQKIWKIDIQTIFSSDFNKSKLIETTKETINSELRIRFFNRPQVKLRKWLDFNSELIQILLDSYGYYTKDIIYQLIEYELESNNYLDHIELPVIQQDEDKDPPLFEQESLEEEKPEFQSEQEEEEEGEESEEEPDIQVSDLKTVSQHRKAFVNWVNKDLYKKIDSLQKKLSKDPKSIPPSLHIYQLLVREYLSLETPYRGVLVYHGLGTGKTASAISLAEGLSTELKINTILPASLETEFIKEIQTWGHNELNKDGLWKYYSEEDIVDNKMREELDIKYNLNEEARTKIMKNVQKYIKRKMFNDDPDTKKLFIKKMEKQILKIKGVWLPDKDGKHKDKMSEYEQVYIDQQINYLIRKKYNFIHYNPFPRVSQTSIGEFIENDDEEDELDLLLEPELQKKLNTENKIIVDKLENKLKKNRRDHYINSPFYNEVIIIDEVHNLVRQILNDNSQDEKVKREARRAKIFYEWIINAENVKLIFLSGTPVINKPCEIAILYNMLKGLIKIYTFTIQTDIEVEEAYQKLNDFYFQKPSPIELFHVDQREGKLVISFIQEKTNFKSLRDEENNIIYSVKTNDTSFPQFIHFIYSGLHEIFDKNDILPKATTLKGLSEKELGKIQLGEPITYDKDLNIIFNRHQRLFDIYEDGTLIDTTEHGLFMKYFFENGDIIPEKKRILLKRMLMGLTSYYPIDRSSIVYMPQIQKPTISEKRYSEYKIVKNMNIVLCPMSQIQFSNYMSGWEWQKTIEDLQKKRNIWEEEIHHYNIRTRQACNVVFNDEENFRMMKRGKSSDKQWNEERNKEIERLKQAEYDRVRDNRLFKIDKNLNEHSPKFAAIFKNMSKFLKDKKPTGKILFYSDFRSDAGSEAFELMLQCNGYTKLDSEKLPDTKELRYTFITGSESPEERRISRSFFNDELNEEKKNKYGEYCQVMIISSAGAEGISLTCVRQVHILEPYWNYVRLDQVLGRAIRMRSHIGKDINNPVLPKEKQNVEQYLYITELPKGMNPTNVYSYLSKLDTWDIPKNWKLEDIKTELSKESNQEYRALIDNIIHINENENESSSDEYLFQVMEEKYKYSLEINNIIKESSLDCIKHTTDDAELNDRCIRFSDKLIDEIAYFPGIGSKVIEQIDTIQLKSKYIYYIEPNIYVIAAKEEGNEDNLFIYYEYTTKEKDPEKIDIRYLRENGKKLCEVYGSTNRILNYVDSKHPYNERLEKEFSVYQEIYVISDDIIKDYTSQNKFPSLDKIILEENLEGYKLKYNINETFYFMGLDSIRPKKCIQKIYPYSIYEKDYSILSEKPILILEDKLYIQD